MPEVTVPLTGEHPEAVQEVARELKSVTGTLAELRSLYEAANKSLVEARGSIEDFRKNGDPVSREKADKIATDFALRAQAIEEMKTRLSKVESAFARPGTADPGTRKAEEERAAFDRIVALRKGRVVIGEPTPVQVQDYPGYCNAFERYVRRGDKALTPEQTRGLEAGSGPDGGYFIPQSMSQTILTQVYESSPIRQIANVEQTSTGDLEFVVDEGQVGAGWVSELGTRSESTTPQLGKLMIVVQEMYAWPRATQKLLDEAARNVEQWLTAKIVERFARLEATAFVAGSGTGQPRGFTTYPNGTNRGQVEQVNTGSTSGLTIAGINNIMSSVKEFYQPDAQWLFRRASLAQLLGIKDDAGQYPFLFTTVLSPAATMTLMGKPIKFAQDMPAIASAALAYAYGNFRYGYTIVDQVGMTILRDPYTATPEIIFKTHRRVGGEVTTFEAIKLGKCSV